MVTNAHCIETLCHGETSPSHIVKLRELCDLFGMKQIINEPTGATLEGSNFIDHIAKTNCNNIILSGGLKISLNDHYLAYCVRKLRGSIKHQHKYITSSQRKNINKETFLSDLQG